MPIPAPQSLKWPADRALLLVHGVGNAVPGTYDGVVQQLSTILSEQNDRYAIYSLYYDQVNDWFAGKTQAALGFASLVNAVRSRLDATRLGKVAADVVGDVIWPVLLADVRDAVRTAYLRQLQQIVLDGKRAGVEVPFQRLSIISHSLGCFHTFEALHAAARSTVQGLAPGTDGVRFENVIFVASPVQLIRAVAQMIGPLVPRASTLNTVSLTTLDMPAEMIITGAVVPSAKRTVSMAQRAGGPVMRRYSLGHRPQATGHSLRPLRLRSVALVSAILIACSSRGLAQTREYTLEDMLVALRKAADEVHFATVDSSANHTLDSLTKVLRSSGATRLSVDALAAISLHDRAQLHVIARASPQRYASWSQPWFATALVGVRQIANTPLMKVLVDQKTKEDVGALIEPLSALHTAIVRHAQSANEEKLRRYEWKYGPNAPRLNGPEVVLNYLAQWIWPFVPHADGPSPFEVVVSYSTTGVTIVHKAGDEYVARMVATTHLGVRHYRFGWGEGGLLSRLVKPRTTAIGLMAMSTRDEPLTTPFKGAQRVGVFLEWGGIRTAVAMGKERRVVVGRRNALIPYLY